MPTISNTSLEIGIEEICRRENGCFVRPKGIYLYEEAVHDGHEAAITRVEIIEMIILSTKGRKAR